jgi:hypothetical protein
MELMSIKIRWIQSIKKNVFYYLFCAALIGPVQLFAAQRAVVKSSRAIIYSDKQLLSPLGYVKNGKVLLVGEVPRKSGTILPVVISAGKKKGTGQIGYIKISDITLEKDRDLNLDEKPSKNRGELEHTVYNMYSDGEEDNFWENNYITLKASNQTWAGDWKKITDGLGIAEDVGVVGYQLIWEHRPLFKKLTWGLGMGLYRTSNTEVELIVPTFEFDFHYDLWKGGVMNIDVIGGAMLSLDTRLNIASPAQQLQGSLWGYKVGGRIKFFPAKKFNIVLGGQYQSLTVNSIGSVQLSNETMDFKSMSGFSLFGGISIGV